MIEFPSTKSPARWKTFILLALQHLPVPKVWYRSSLANDRFQRRNRRQKLLDLPTTGNVKRFDTRLATLCEVNSQFYAESVGHWIITRYQSIKSRGTRYLSNLRINFGWKKGAPDLMLLQFIISISLNSFLYFISVLFTWGEAVCGWFITLRYHQIHWRKRVWQRTCNVTYWEKSLENS